jgi:ATP-dependent RNA helicase DeaD
MENTFEKLGLSAELANVLKEGGILEPREIQAKAIPLSLKGKDIIGGSATGSGKTLAFGANIVENVVKGDGIQALIMAPTRELADQVNKSLKFFSKHKKLEILSIYGGMDMNYQIRKLHEADIVVGTPGRLLDHLNRRTIDLSKVKYLVLDEADRMLEMGFIEDVEKIMKSCPKERQTMLFSATISRDIDHIIEEYMNDPESIHVEHRVDPTKLKQVFYDTTNFEKFSLLVHLLKKEKAGLVMVFCNTQRNTDAVANNLKAHKIHAVAIHGGLAQNKRNRIMEDFKNNYVEVLVCTDVAARGIDVNNVSHVYNYDLPKDSKEYVHRIGRTARAGKEGIAINIVAQRDYENFNNILRREDFEIKEEPKPNFEKVFFKMDSDGPRGRDGRSGGSSRDGGRGRRDSGRDSGRSSGGRSSGGRSSGRDSGRSYGKPSGRPSSRGPALSASGRSYSRSSGSAGSRDSSGRVGTRGSSGGSFGGRRDSSRGPSRGSSRDSGRRPSSRGSSGSSRPSRRY